MMIGDLVALTSEAAAAMGVSMLSELAVLRQQARAELLLPAPRILAYEHEWCLEVEKALDGRAETELVAAAARRLAWSRSESMDVIWESLGFLVLIL
jgi:hypothetical protein